MALVKVRRDGNSLAVTIPAEEARKLSLEEGAYVEVEADAASGGLWVRPVEIAPRVRPEVLAAGRKVIEENRGLYERLAKHDRDSE